MKDRMSHVAIPVRKKDLAAQVACPVCKAGQIRQTPLPLLRLCDKCGQRYELRSEE